MNSVKEALRSGPAMLATFVLAGMLGACGSDTSPILRVSVNSAGAGADANCGSPSISADGRYVVFSSSATNLVTGDTNGAWDIFVHDAQSGTTTRVSVNSEGAAAYGDSGGPSISADGRYVAFTSSAINLVTGDTNGERDVFVHDTQTGTTTRVSVNSAGTEADGYSSDASISADGRYVTFDSLATNLVTGDTNGTSDVFVHARQTGTTTRLSVDSAGTEANGYSSSPSISSNGRYVVFRSTATNLVTGDTNGTGDVLVHDAQTGTTTRVSVDSAGAEADDDSGDPSVSADGRYVAFTSSAINLVIGDTNGERDVFVHDTQTGTTTRVSLDSAGAEADGASGNPSVSADGRYVAFEFGPGGVSVYGDPNGLLRGVFVHDALTETATRVSVDSSGTEADADSDSASISADGRYVAFTSWATNLVNGDTNGVWDVFRAPNQ